MSLGQINPYENTSSDNGEEKDNDFPSGDAFLVYPYKDTVLHSIREYVFREGLQDYRALKTLEKYKSREYVVNLINKEGVKGFKTYPRSKEWHLDFRNRINQEIERAIHKH